MSEVQESSYRTLTKGEVRQRTSTGIFYLASTNLASLLIGFFSNLALARLLTPHDFGLVAVGMTFTLVGGAVADGGLGVGMIRRVESPTNDELKTLNGIQLAVSLALVVPTVAIALQFGRGGAVTAIMAASLPLTTLQTPGRVTLTRQMKYQRQSLADLAATVLSQVFAVVSVVLGAGVWGLASAAVVKAAVAAVLIGGLSVGLQAPSLKRWREFGDLLRFGFSFQANWIVIVIRDQGLNVIVAAIAGVQVLGLWSLARRVLEVPVLLFGALANLSYPAMASLLARGEDPGPVVLRSVRLSAVAGTIVFVPFAAASPSLIPLVFGDRWRHAADVLPLAAYGALTAGSVAIGTVGFLFALGRPRQVLLASVIYGGVWVGVTAACLPFVGIVAIGIGAVAGAVAQTISLDVDVRKVAGVAPMPAVVRPLGVALVAGIAGWWICELGRSSILLALASASAAFLLSLAGLWTFCRHDLEETVRVFVRSLREALGQGHSPA